MNGKKKSPPVEEKENLNRWLISYSDFMTLLFAVFVVLFAITNLDLKKLKNMTASFESAVVSYGIGNESLAFLFKERGKESLILYPFSETGLSRDEVSEFISVRDALKSAITEDPSLKNIEQDVVFDIDQRGLIIQLRARDLFASGSAEINPAALQFMDKTASFLSTTNYLIRIEGHTDSIPISTPRYRSNWELSADRANRIVKYLVTRYNLFPERLSASGYGEFKPIRSNDTEEGREQNRRIEIILLGKKESLNEPINRVKE
ncbi:MAG: flagellar motor protein MotB [Nitrospinae bacterium]|nr:flagellar motor protein MotB [Nitrospinota bacterium]